MTVIFDGSLSRGTWTLTVDDLRLRNGVTAVIGANGTGKTSLVRAIAGLQRLSSGRLMIGDRLVDDAAQSVFVAPHLREVGMVFADHRLFGHMRAVDNVAFGLRRAGTDKTTARRRAAELLERVGVDAAAHSRRPAQLSGGQQQRVAIARALATSPKVLIVDEPLASVDSAGRALLRSVIAESEARCVVLITHDPVDVATLATDVAVLDNGTVVSHGTLAEVTSAPGCEWAATFLGANVVAGQAHRNAVTTAGGLSLTVAEQAEGAVYVTFGAHAVTLHRERPEGSARNAWQAELQRVDIDGERARVHLGGAMAVRADVTRRSADELDLKPGAMIWASVKATELTVVS